MPTLKSSDNSQYTWLLISMIVVGVIIGNAFLAIRTIDDLSSSQSSLSNTGDVIVALDELHIMVLSAETGQRGYLLTEVESYLLPYQDSLSKVTQQMDKVRNMKSEIPGQNQKILDLLDLIAVKLKELELTVDLALSNREKSALKIVMTGRGRNLTSEIRQLFVEVETAEINFRSEQHRKLATVRNEAQVTFVISAITSFLLLIGMVFLARLNSKNERRHLATLETQNRELAEKVEERTAELYLYSEELERSNRELEDFAFVASHDLQEPLRKIRAFGDRLQTSFADSLGEKGSDYVDRMRNAAERMSNLINDLLEFSRITTRGKDFVDVDLNKIMALINDDLEITISESNAQINVCELPIVEADASQMHQLFLNLTTNAIKFRKENVEPKITFTYAFEERTISIQKEAIPCHVITITDNGIGFDQEYSDKIFSPFKRLHSRTEYSGTGIGLAVCRRIVERHRGCITAVSEIGLGSTFTIILPQEIIPIGFDGEN
ncbi:sensor histidine kinase [Aliiglaciecola sp. LCG003]|uniref:sensor histidine kinase n=1 Tax=Aliiglaciecola sp. LCG003 TaxID=3053655 RepID=UPI002572604D|nr:sensor histidine kinase [Aliiglaciecola sp. LCG003]WJG09649.1 CHASE3 domain-containing protein [Aliiglaciecola sp. LCG003]